MSRGRDDDGRKGRRREGGRRRLIKAETHDHTSRGAAEEAHRHDPESTRQRDVGTSAGQQRQVGNRAPQGRTDRQRPETRQSSGGSSGVWIVLVVILIIIAAVAAWYFLTH